MKRRYWLLFAAAVFTVLLSLCFFGVRVRVMPRLVLSRAMDTALEKLDARFENSPMNLLLPALSPEGCQHASLQLETKQPVLGVVYYDMQLSTQLNPSRLHADGAVVTGGKLLDLSVYMDGDFAAVASEELADGGYYGITYDTFSRDIRGKQLLAALIGEKTITQWEDSVSSVDAVLSWNLRLPGFRGEDVISALYGVLALKPQVSRVSTPAGAAPNAHAVTFRMSAQEIIRVVENYRNQLPPEILNWLDGAKEDPEAYVLVEFMLHKDNLVQIRLEAQSARSYTQIYVALGDDPDIQDLSMDITLRTENRSSYVYGEISTDTSAGNCRERMYIAHTGNGKRSRISLAYDFDPRTGELDLTVARDDEKAQLRLNLSGEGETVTLRTQDLRPLLNLLQEQDKAQPVICTLVLSPGEAVEVPQYRNMDQWSLDDLYGLLSGLGGLLGLKMQ